MKEFIFSKVAGKQSFYIQQQSFDSPNLQVAQQTLTDVLVNWRMNRTITT